MHCDFIDSPNALRSDDERYLWNWLKTASGSSRARAWVFINSNQKWNRRVFVFFFRSCRGRIHSFVAKIGFECCRPAERFSWSHFADRHISTWMGFQTGKLLIL